MKILVTGGCGFVGSNICLNLKQKYKKIYSLDTLSRQSSKLNYTLLKKNTIKNYHFDIFNQKN